MSHDDKPRIAAIVLAAGLARRMGSPKVLLPWGHSPSILDHIVAQLKAAEVDHILVVTGHEAGKVREIAARHDVEIVHNPDYATGEMLSSLKVGVRALPEKVAAALVVLGDQPRIQPEIVQRVVQAYTEGKGSIVAPSYQMRRGHPILIDRRYWDELLALPADGAPRDLINAHADEIAYVTVDTDSVLGDVDTPEDYEEERRRAGQG
jgi:molybdenum cofactor cytidylyltransferase